jgi:PadR family transcriptional regulator PadR
MTDDNSFMSGLPELAILRLLQDREMYGYEIVQAIAVRTGATLSPGEGVIYPLLHALEKSGALKSRRKSVNGRSRVYYTQTAKGARRLSALTNRWSELNGAVQALMGGMLAVR